MTPQAPPVGARAVAGGRTTRSWVRRVVTWGQWALGIALVAVVVNAADVRGLGRVVHPTHPWWLLAAVLAELLSFAAAVVVQQASLQAAGGWAGWRLLGRVTLVSTGLGYALPAGSAIATVWAARRLRRGGTPASSAAGSQLLYSGLIGAALGAIGILGAGASDGRGLGDEGRLSLLVVSVVFVVLSAALLAVSLRPRMRARLVKVGWVARVLGQPEPGANVTSCGDRNPDGEPAGRADDQPRAQAAESAPAGVGTTRAEGAGGSSARPAATVAAGFAAEVVVFLVDLACLHACLDAYGVHVPRPVLLAAYAAVQMLSLLPVTPGGFGLVEGGLTVLLAVRGASGTGGIAAAVLVYRILSYWSFVTLGAVAYLWDVRAVRPPAGGRGMHTDAGDVRVATPGGDAGPPGWTPPRLQP